jgi:hypothetical protein
MTLADRIAEIEARANAATKGPWRLHAKLFAPRQPEPLTRHFDAEDAQNQRGRVHATLKLLQDRERGEDEQPVCSNSRCEELCHAVIEASVLLDSTQEALREAIADARSNAEERDEAKAQVISDCNVLNQEIDECRSLSESLNGQNIALAQRLVVVTKECDALRAACLKCGLAFAHGLRCHAIAQNEGGERG